MPTPPAPQPDGQQPAGVGRVVPPPIPKTGSVRSCFFAPRILALFALVVLVSGFVWVRYAGASPLAWYPQCLLWAHTGIFCPGCGSARLLHDLAHGDIRAACGHNILILIALPFLAVWAVLALWRGIVRNQPPPQAPLGTARIVLVVVVVFWVARNLPWMPFSLLAPAP